MLNFRRSALFAAIMPLVGAPAWGLGLGEITMQSYLNEPLVAEVALLDVQGLAVDDIKVRLATAEDFDRLGVERAYFLTSVNFDVQVGADGGARILLTTTEPLLEPYLDFILEARWPAGRLLREYTVLVDLPRMDNTRVMASSSSRTEDQQETASEPEPVAEPSAPRASPRAPRPERQYDRDTRVIPEPGSRYLVVKNDTLWDIAAKARPAGASVEQTMLATVDMNPQAFTGGNINGLRAGYVLYLPSDDDIEGSNADAIARVSQHNQDWRDGVRRRPALRVVADSEVEPDYAGTTESTDELAMAESIVNPEAAAPDTVEVAQAGDVAPIDSDESMADSGSTDAMQTSADASGLADIQVRLSELAQQVEQLSQLVSVKDEQIAALQAQLQAKENASVATSAAPARAAAPGSGSFIPWWAYTILGIGVLLGGGWVALRLRNRGEQEASSVAAPVVPARRQDVARPASPAEPVAKSESTPSEDAGLDSGGERGYGQRLYNEYAQEGATADALAEADIYVAYGRYQQAIDLLKAAVDSDPKATGAYSKLLEIYLKTDRREEADALIPAIERTGDAELIAQARSQLTTVDSGPSSPVAIDAAATEDKQAPDWSAPSGGEAALDFEMVSPAVPVEPADTDDKEDDKEIGAAVAGDEDTVTASIANDVDSDLESGLELELELPAREGEEEGGMPAPVAEADWGALDGGGSSSDLHEELELEAASPDPEADEASIDDISSDLADVSSGDEIAAPEDESGDLVVADEGDPIASKLDLARAYIDMGDDDGARPVLEEVIAEGDLQQQAEARELLLRIE
ncbi:LysM domain protein [Luminiphilus syltensis NOR5-1B]|uniref:LysM domain protein n=1 Tax=Luminiphilus syltensis NOR5-1B TaxID=565045 RepID=B8KYD3_9GAMM|nr:FimV/HubP family polar landmark protein [Luminiphilus syltensis]EED36097.1 LysM domain protein [Luminiphilus syltensis NOR5-1B]